MEILFNLLGTYQVNWLWLKLNKPFWSLVAKYKETSLKPTIITNFASQLAIMHEIRHTPKERERKKKVYINYQLNKKNWGLIGYINTRLMKEKKHCFCQTESHLNCVFDHVNDNCLSFYFC